MAVRLGCRRFHRKEQVNLAMEPTMEHLVLVYAVLPASLVLSAGSKVHQTSEGRTGSRCSTVGCPVPGSTLGSNAILRYARTST